MPEHDDFELDPESLKRIEEEARRQVESEFELDSAAINDIREMAKLEAELYDVADRSGDPG